MTTTTNSNTDKTYYEILGIDNSNNTATDLDIKRAYRKLALKYHPDRSSEENKELATAKFQEIGEAYNCLSDINRKREYDHYLKYSNSNRTTSNNFNNNNNNSFATTTTTTTNNTNFEQQQQQRRRQQSSSSSSPRQQQQQRQRFAAARRHYDSSGRRKVDPFEQFDYVFRTDPFFHDAFKDLDDEFARRFQQQQEQQQPRGGSGGNNLFSTTSSPSQQQSNNNNINEGWFIWLLRQCGIQFQVSSYKTDRHGNVSASHYSSSTTSRDSSQNNNTSLYTKKVSQTYVDNQGRNITIKQMQRGPNSIQDKYIGNELIERRVNGQIVNLASLEN